MGDTRALYRFCSLRLTGILVSKDSGCNSLLRNPVFSQSKGKWAPRWGAPWSQPDGPCTSRSGECLIDHTLLSHLILANFRTGVEDSRNYAGRHPAPLHCFSVLHQEGILLLPIINKIMAEAVLDLLAPQVRGMLRILQIPEVEGGAMRELIFRLGQTSK